MLPGGTFVFGTWDENCRILNVFNFAHPFKSPSTYFRTETCDQLKCEWGQGSKYLFGTQLCYFIAGIFTRCMRDPCYERRRDEEPAPAPKSPKPVKEAEPKQEELEVEKGQGSDNEDEEK